LHDPGDWAICCACPKQTNLIGRGLEQANLKGLAPHSANFASLCDCRSESYRRRRRASCCVCLRRTRATAAARTNAAAAQAAAAAIAAGRRHIVPPPAGKHADCAREGGVSPILTCAVPLHPISSLQACRCRCMWRWNMSCVSLEDPKGGR
jgi:hypothetical protein